MRYIVLILCISSVVYAQNDPRDEPTDPGAHAHFVEGGKLFLVRNFEQAILEYKAGALIQPLPVFDLTLAQCYRLLRRYDIARWYFERFIKYGHPGTKLLEAIENLMNQMSDSEVEVEHLPSASSSSSFTERPQPETKTEPEPEPGEPWYHDGVGFGITGSGAVALGVATYLLVSANRLHNESNSDAVSEGRRAELYDRAGTRYWTGSIVGALGSAVFIAGIVKLIVHPEEHARRVNVGISGSGDLVVFGRF